MDAGMRKMPLISYTSVSIDLCRNWSILKNFQEGESSGPSLIDLKDVQF